jgi:hypothetical protein
MGLGFQVLQRLRGDLPERIARDDGLGSDLQGGALRGPQHGALADDALEPLPACVGGQFLIAAVRSHEELDVVSGDGL